MPRKAAIMPGGECFLILGVTRVGVALRVGHSAAAQGGVLVDGACGCGGWLASAVSSARAMAS
jgi:hypothetical protein